LNESMVMSGIYLVIRTFSIQNASVVDVVMWITNPDELSMFPKWNTFSPFVYPTSR